MCVARVRGDLFEESLGTHSRVRSAHVVLKRRRQQSFEAVGCPGAHLAVSESRRPLRTVRRQVLGRRRRGRHQGERDAALAQRRDGNHVDDLRAARAGRGAAQTVRRRHGLCIKTPGFKDPNKAGSFEVRISKMHESWGWEASSPFFYSN